MSRARIESKASGLAISAKREAFWNRNLVDRPLSFSLVMRLAFTSGVSRWRATAMVEFLGIGSRPLKGTSSYTCKPTK